MAFTGNKLFFSRKQKEPLHLVSTLNGTVPVIGKVTSMEYKWKCPVTLLAAVPAYGNLERLRKKLSIIEASSPERTSDINALKEAKNTVELFERLYGNAKTGASGLSHGRKIKDNLQDIITSPKITSLKNKTKKSKTHGLGEIWEKTVPMLRVCTDGIKTKLMKYNNTYNDDDHGEDNKTAYFGDYISADEIPYIVLPGTDIKRNDRFKYSLGVIVKKNKKIDKNDEYLFCVVAETGPVEIKVKEKNVENTLGEVSIYAAWILKGLNVSSINTTEKTRLRNNYKIGNISVEDDGVEYKIIVFEKSAPVSNGHRGGWDYKHYHKNDEENHKKNYKKNAKKFRQHIVDQGEYILGIYNNSIKDDKKSKITGNCLNPEKKTTIKKALKKITAFCLLALLLAGCQKPVIKGTENIAVKEETAQPATTAPENQEPVQAKEKNLSEIYDWENARIMQYPYYPNFGEGQVLQNQDYVFYPEDGCKIARINKADRSKKIICRFRPVKKEKEYIYTYYCLSDDGLFIEYNGNIYSCGFDGTNLHKIISRKKLKKQVTAIEPDAWRYGKDKTLKFHQSNLYLSIYSFIWKLDLKTKKIKKMSEDASDACLLGSSLYYTSIWDHSLYKTDTRTGKSSRITKKACYALTETDGELYYVYNLNIYMYHKGKKDKKIFSFKKKINYSSIENIESDSGKIAVTYIKKKRYHEGRTFELKSVAIYDTNTSAFSKIENIRDFFSLEYFTGDMLFYYPENWNYEEYLSSLSYPQPARDKTFKITRENITQPGSTEYTPQESQEEKLSDKYDWDSAKITIDYQRRLLEPDFGNGLILQNENYIFYPEDGYKIIRINKKDKTVKPVCRFDPAKKTHMETGISFCLSDSRLFISYAGNIYSCGFEGEDFHKILSLKKLKKLTGLYWPDVYAICFHKGSLYLSSDVSSIYRLDLETKKATRISDYYNTIDGCLCGNALYYTTGTGGYGYSLYRADTRTGKCTLIADTGIHTVTEAGGKPYYLEYDTWKNTTIYMYRKGKKDKKIWESDIAVSEACCAPGKIAMRYYSSQKYDSFDNNVLIYDINTSTITKIENIPDIHTLVGLSGDMLFYIKNLDDKYLSYLAY